MSNGLVVDRDFMKIGGASTHMSAGFSGTALNTDRWTPIQGPGGTLTVGGGNLTIGLGTNAGERNGVISNQVFRLPCRLVFGLNLSQRIANQDIIVELISVDQRTGLPDGLNNAAFVLTGTTVTSGVCRVQNDGSANLDSSQTILTTASQAHFEINANLTNTRFINHAIDNSTSMGLNFIRTQGIPDPNAYYKIRVSGVNGATPPASNTNIVLNYLRCIEFNPTLVEIHDTRQNLPLGIANTGVGSTSTTALNIQGAVADDGSVGTLSPITNGWVARTSNPAAKSASGDVVFALATMIGAIVSRPNCIPEAAFQSTGTLTTTTAGTIRAAAGAGIKGYICSFQYQNTNATATQINIRRGTTVIASFQATANMVQPATIEFQEPLQSAANEVLEVIALTTGASVLWNAQGYAAP